MHKRYELIPSQAMGRRMSLWCFGHWGAPLMVFPTAAGFAHEWDAQGMVEALAPLIDGGKLKLYCPESNIARTWTDKEDVPEARVGRHRAYESFIMNELVPWVREDCRSPEVPLAATGSSLGGFYAANFALKFPEVFRYALCMSGRYKITEFTGGVSSPEIYFNDPLAYVPNLGGEALERVRRNTHLTLVCGQGPWEEGCIEETIRLADILESKDIPHDRDIWGQDVSHNWVWWKRQAWMHLQRRYG